MCSRCEGQVSDTFVKGMATIFWGDAWATHAEEHGCCNLSGCEITEYMPEIPELAWRLAERWAGRIEQANGTGLAAIFAQAMRADAKAGKRNDADLVHEDYHGPEAERFGECLAYMVMGAGVSWFDDHAKFDLKVPQDCGSITTDLEAFAESQCDEDTGRKQCTGCRSWYDPRKTTKFECGECGEPYPELENE